MNTTPAVASLSVSLQGGTLQEITSVLEAGINIAATFPAAAPGAAIADLILQLISAAAARIQQQTGKPVDLSAIPIEQPLP